MHETYSSTADESPNLNRPPVPRLGPASRSLDSDLSNVSHDWYGGHYFNIGSLFQVVTTRAKRFAPDFVVQQTILKTIDFMAKFRYGPVKKKIFDFVLSNAS